MKDIRKPNRTFRANSKELEAMSPQFSEMLEVDKKYSDSKTVRKNKKAYAKAAKRKIKNNTNKYIEHELEQINENNYLDYMDDLENGYY